MPYNREVKPEIADKLRQLNHQFYQTFAGEFAATRQRLQPGVLRVLRDISPEADILDLGCGAGELARELARRGHQGTYTGLDFSEELMAHARQDLPEDFKATFHQADLTTPDWDADLPKEHYDVVMAFAVLHHIPGMDLRIQVARKVRTLIKPEGQFIHSSWQFLNSDRLKNRVQPWEEAGLREEDVEPGDYLLDWRRGGRGLRYVHLLDLKELSVLAFRSRFRIKGLFRSDGEGGVLGLYEVWERKG